MTDHRNLNAWLIMLHAHDHIWRMKFGSVPRDKHDVMQLAHELMIKIHLRDMEGK
jgi:hypothetical protein